MIASMKEKLISLALSILIPLFLLSASIACPILIRGFYYGQIERLDLPARTGYSAETIREAYDDVLDYCTKGGERAGLAFQTGNLKWSETGKAHFDDVERLFHLDFVIAGVTGGLLVLVLLWKLLLWMRRKHGLQIHRFRRKGPLFWGPVVMLGILGILGVLAAINFDAFFAGFHHLFFPGRDNWIFDPATDEIIRILPEEVFRNFGLMILEILAAGCGICIVADIQAHWH